MSYLLKTKNIFFKVQCTKCSSKRLDGKSFFDLPIKNEEETYEQIIGIGRNNDYTTGNLLDYEYFSKHYKLIETDLSREIELEKLDLKQQISFIGRLQRNEVATMFFIIKKSEEMNFHKILQQLFEFLCYLK